MCIQSIQCHVNNAESTTKKTLQYHQTSFLVLKGGVWAEKGTDVWWCNTVS